MRFVLALVCTCTVVISPAVADCSLGDIEVALEAPLGGLNKLEREATDIQSTEGGAWEIYREKDGRVNTIIRMDYGETGRLETRLSMVNRGTYGIASTTIEYTRHIYLSEDGPLATKRRSTDYFYYCDGKPMLGGEAALAKQKSMLLNPDVADFTKGLAR